jgi:hypothetical protein
MLNLDAISRNLFGTGSISGRSGTGSMASSDMFSSTSRRSKSNMSRTSTMSLSISSTEEHKRLSRMSSSLSVRSDYDGEGDDTLIAGVPYNPAGNMGQSEVDLNERLNLARKNSKTVGALSPPTAAGRLAAKSVAELRTRVEERVEVVAHGRLGVRSVGDLKEKVEEEGVLEAIALVEEACKCHERWMCNTDYKAVRSGSPTPLSPTAPLRIRNKTPSPTKGLRTSEDVPTAGLGIVPPITHGGASRVSAPKRPESPFNLVYPPISDIMISPRTIVSPPPVRAGSVSSTAPLSPRPHGPRSPGINSGFGMGRPLNPPVPGLGSGHTKLRVMSGNGRKVSPSRATIPLKGDDTATPDSRGAVFTCTTPVNAATPTPRIVSNKRQHSSDQITPRKKSPSKSPAVLRGEEAGDENVGVDASAISQGQMGDPLKVPSFSKRPVMGLKVSQNGSRRSSGVSAGTATPTRSSGPLTTPRTVSGATNTSVVSTTTVESTITEKIHSSKYRAERNMEEHVDSASAIEATRIRVCFCSLKVYQANLGF